MIDSESLTCYGKNLYKVTLLAPSIPPLDDSELPSQIGAAIVFESVHRVRFRDVDPYGHMNMAHYLAYYGDHRFEGMRRFIGLDLKAIAELPIAFHTRSVEIEYLKPLVADQEFKILSYVAELRRSQCYVALEMQNESSEKVSTARMRIGCIDKVTGRPCGWPGGLMERFFR